MTPLAGNDFVSAARNNPVLMKYGKKPPASKPADTAANKPATNGTLPPVAEEVKPTNGSNSSNQDSAQRSFENDGVTKGSTSLSPNAPAFVSASEKMSALTSASKVEFALLNAVPGLEAQFRDLSSNVTELISGIKILAMNKTGLPTPPDSGDSKTPESAKSSSVTQHAQPNATGPSLIPSFITEIPAYKPTELLQTPLGTDEKPVTFTLAFLKDTLGGDEFSPGLYYPAHSLTEFLTEDKNERQERLRRAGSTKTTVKPRKEKETWYCFDAALNPFVPQKMAAHGAALTPFFHDFDSDSAEDDEKNKQRFIDVPLFVALPSEAAEKQYIYMGQYTQPRWSDKLSTNESTFLPTNVLQHWARALTASTRPDWLTEALANHLAPKPTFELPDSDSPDDLKSAIEDFKEELTDWDDDKTKAVENLSEEKIMKLFSEPDAADPPGIRFWWEYLKCVGFDRGFYLTLASKKRETGGGQFDGAATVGDGIPQWGKA